MLAYMFVKRSIVSGSIINFLFKSVCSTYDLFERVFLRILSFVFYMLLFTVNISMWAVSSCLHVRNCLHRYVSCEAGTPHTAKESPPHCVRRQVGHRIKIASGDGGSLTDISSVAATYAKHTVCGLGGGTVNSNFLINFLKKTIDSPWLLCYYSIAWLSWADLPMWL